MTKLPQRQRLAALLCAAGLGTWALPSAAEIETRFSGFGTLAATVTDKDGTQFRQSVDQFSGADKDVDFLVDSRAAVQGTVTYNTDFSLTAQVLANRREGKDFKVGFEWLYAQYTGLEGLDLKAGRVVLPAFLVSDSRHVGYAVPWVRVPPLVYGMMPLSHVDGAQATYRRSVGSAVVSGQVTTGKGKGNVSSVYPVPLGPLVGTLYGDSVGGSEADNVLGLNLAVEWDSWTFRISQIHDHSKLNTKVYVPTFTLPAPFNAPPFSLDPQIAGLAALSGSTISQPLKFKDTFRELGVQYDDGKLLVVAEYVKRTTDPKVQLAYSWYVGAGYRFGAFTPYATVSQYKVTHQDQGNVPPKSNGLALGGRYDLGTNLAIKAEWAQYKTNSTYIFTNISSPDVADKKVNVMTVALDFVF